MAIEENKKQDIRKNLKTLENLVKDNYRPYIVQLADIKSSVKKIFEEAKSIKEELIRKEMQANSVEKNVVETKDSVNNTDKSLNSTDIKASDVSNTEQTESVVVSEAPVRRRENIFPENGVSSRPQSDRPRPFNPNGSNNNYANRSPRPNTGDYNRSNGGYQGQQGNNRTNSGAGAKPYNSFGKPGFNKDNKSNIIPAAPISPKDFKNNNIIDKKKNDNKKYDDRTVNKKVKTKGYAYDYNDYDNDNENARHVKVRRIKKQQFIEPQNTKIESAIITSDNVSIKTLSEKIGKTANEIIKTLFLLGIIKTINEEIDFPTAELVSDSLGIKLELKKDLTFEEKLEDFMINDEVESDYAEPRPPIVTIMGHVDHGKTSLLDYIRRTKVTATEAGGITQHIGAYTVNINNNPITFLDTPGHEAFTTMRARGAQVTDIAIIVVAAEDGIKPQTIEAINHAKSAGVTVIIAMNKIDKPEADPSKVMQQLTAYEIIPEEWGGDTICVPVSAKTGFNVDKLLESILLVAELKELKANPNCKAKGTIIEAKLDKARGPVATILVQNGTLNVSDYVVAGTTIGKIKAMIDDKGRNIKTAGPSTPVSVLGFSDVPDAGDLMVVVKDEKLAKQVAEERRVKIKNKQISTASTSLEDMFKNMQDGQIKELNLIIKTDVQGSYEALKQELIKLSNEEVRVKVIHGGVGAISESDIMLASTANAITIGFNVRPDTNAKNLAERNKVDIKIYRIIYDAINDIKLALNGMLEPTFEEVIVGHAEIRATFGVRGIGTIAGCMVRDGKISRANKVRLLRDNIIITETEVSSLKREKDDVKEVAAGYECGIGLQNYNDIKEGDIIECFILEEVKK